MGDLSGGQMIKRKTPGPNRYYTFRDKEVIEFGRIIKENINRYLKKSGDVIKFSDYQYDGNWKVEISEKSYKQNNIHFLLTKRTFKNGDIFEELKSIKLVQIDIKKVII